jgi:hypothetical protein
MSDDFERSGKIYFGTAHGDTLAPARLSDAIADVAEQVVRDGTVTPDHPVWFDIVQLKVEIANQHVKTYVVGATQQGTGPTT